MKSTLVALYAITGVLVTSSLVCVGGTEANKAWAQDKRPENAVAKIAPSPGAVAWWAGEGNVNDSIGNNNGVSKNGASYLPGLVGQAFVLAEGAYLEIPDAPELNFTGTQPMSLELWAFRTGLGTTMHLVSKRVSAYEAEYQMAFDPFSGLHLDSIFMPWDVVIVATGVQLPLNQWWHLAATFDGAQFRFYTNGALAATSSGILGKPNSETLRIGSINYPSDPNPFEGLLDEISIYNRALEPAEIQAIYSAGIRFHAADNTVKRLYATNAAMVTTLAGDGVAGFSDGEGYQARFASPNGGRTDAQGNVYIADSDGHRIRLVTAQGVVSTLAGTGIAGYQDGPTYAARFNAPLAACLGRTGEIYVADTGNNCIRCIDPKGYVSTVAGNRLAGFRDGTALNAQFNFPNDLLVDAQGNIVVSEFSNHVVRIISPTGIVSTWAGKGFAGYKDGAATDALFNSPSGLALQADGGILVSEWNGQRIRRIAPIRQVSTVAGDGIMGFVDSLALNSRFNHPDGLAVGNDGSIYVADNGNKVIRRIQTTGRVVTLAGTGQSGFQDGNATVAQFASPAGLGIDPQGNLIVPDSLNRRLRKIAVVPSAPSLVVRRVLPASYAPAQPLLVQIIVTPPAKVSAYAVEERLPSGWNATSISDSGRFDGAQSLIRFGPFVDRQPRTLSYMAWPTITSSGTVAFTGIVSQDGLNSPIAESLLICVTSTAWSHPADQQPTDFRMSIGEMTAYASAWKQGGFWSIAPSPIPIDYLSRAAYLWKNGEFYRYDPIRQPPRCWISLADAPGLDSYSPVNDAALGTLALARPALEEQGVPQEAYALMESSFIPGQPVAIRIIAKPSRETTVYAVEDRPPAGWLIDRISESGTYDAVAGAVKWGPFFDNAPRTLSYQAVPPSDAQRQTAFSGLASFDGSNMAITGSRSIRAGSMAAPPLSLITNWDGTKNLEVSLKAALGAVVSLEYSRDLMSWRPVSTLTNFAGTVTVSDSSLLEWPQGFFRLIPLEETR